MMYFWIILFVILIGVGWYIAKKNNIFSNRLPKNTPVDILKRRFAKGEITEEEYDEKRAVLEEDEYLNTNP